MTRSLLRPGLVLAGLIVAGSTMLLWYRADALESRPVVTWNERAGTVEVSGLTSDSLARLRRAGLSARQWTTLLALHSTSPIDEDRPPMLGSHEVAGGRIIFRPRFPLVRGLQYTARFHSAHYARRFDPGHPARGGPPWIETTLLLPGAPAEGTTVVAQIYPKGDALPANQLKFYLHFSAPMSVGEAHEHIRLLDGAGREVNRAFLELPQELWDAQRQRFTLILDPGRIKRGLRSNVEDGPPLRDGGRYRLVVGTGWRDGDGRPLREPFEKAFRVVAADRTAPDPRAWHLTAPAAGTTEPLRLRLTEALDHALLEEMLVLLDRQGEPVAGRIEIADAESQWLFRPQRPWRAGAYAVRVDAKLEDRAGNNLRRLFDEELRDAVSAISKTAWIDLPFRINATSSD